MCVTPLIADQRNKELNKKQEMAWPDLDHALSKLWPEAPMFRIIIVPIT